MMVGHRFTQLLVVSAALIMSCDPSPACDPGQHEDTGNCLPNTTAGAGDGGDAASSGAGNSDDDDAGTDSCKPGPGHYDGFGDACTSDTDCGCIAPTCATPGLEYCSRLQCQDHADSCPPGWTCTDISAFSTTPGVTHMCIKP